MVIRKATIYDVEQLRPLYTELEKDGVIYQPEHFVIGYRVTPYYDFTDEKCFLSKETNIRLYSGFSCFRRKKELWNRNEAYGSKQGIWKKTWG